MERLTFYENGKAHFSIGYSDYSGKVADKLASYEDAEEAGILARIDERFALAMLAGARAIEQNLRKYFGTTFVHDVFGDKPKEISYHDAAKMLREKAEAALTTNATRHSITTA